MVDLKKITYKPGYKIDISNHHSDSILITVSTEVWDVCEPEKKITFSSSLCLRNEDMKHDDHVLYLIRDLFVRFELHEMDEWLKIDGKHIKTPHKD